MLPVGDSTRLRANSLRYFILSDKGGPYFLARVRWPNIAQAISVTHPYWLDDQGLFDLPYSPASTAVDAHDAEVLARSWGADFPLDETVPAEATPLIRRMPANWAYLTPAERRAWSLDTSMRHRHRLSRGNRDETPRTPHRRHVARLSKSKSKRSR
jgi:hypothetical protein